MGVILSAESIHRAWWEALFSAIFVAIGLWFISSASVFPCVRLWPDALVIDNFIFRYFIPWSLLRDIDVSDGFKVVVKGGKKPVVAFGLSGSVIGALRGYRTNNRVAQAAKAYRRENADRSAGGCVQRRLHVHPLSILMWLFLYGVVVPLLEIYR